jgi:hypothetical protein
MQRQQRLRLGDRNTLHESWARFTNDQRLQVKTLFAELIARAIRATRNKEQRDDAAEK